MKYYCLSDAGRIEDFAEYDSTILGTQCFAKWSESMSYLNDVCPSNSPAVHTQSRFERNKDLEVTIHGRNALDAVWCKSNFELIVKRDLAAELQKMEFSGFQIRECRILNPRGSISGDQYVELSVPINSKMNYVKSRYVVTDQCLVCDFRLGKKTGNGISIEDPEYDFARIWEYPFHKFVSERVFKYFCEIKMSGIRMTLSERLPFRTV